jgi:hypothetical protein
MKKKLTKSILLIYLFTGVLAACRGFPPTPAVTQVEVEETAVATRRPASPLPPTATAAPAGEGIVFYYFVPLTEAAFPEGSVVVMPDAYILAPQRSESPSSQDTAADLRVALKAVLSDERNGWISSDVEIVSVAFSRGHADVVLQGEYYGVGSVTLIAARMQILLTIFANLAIETATVTLNGDTIGNLGIAHSLEAKVADYVFTRAEIEAFMAENMAVSP